MSKKQITIVGLLMAACVAVGVFIATDWNTIPLGLAGPDDVKLGSAAAPVNPGNEVKSLNDAFVAVSQAVTPQVVSITVTSRVSPVSEESDEDNFEGDPRDFFRHFQNPTPQRGSGSGVVVSADGYILTNNHVVEAGTGSIRVELSDGRSYDAQLVGRDSLTDIAVIKIDASDLPAASFGNSDELKVGSLVLAVGNPLGLNSTVTQGIVSALGRGQLNLNRDREGYGIENFIQTDAAINPGNSGGGLFDLRGQLIGINSAIATRTGYYQGYGFAIPIDLARAVAEDLIEDGHVNRGYIGVRIRNIDNKLARALEVPEGHGVLISDVVKGGAGEAAGLRGNDVILEVDGQRVSSSNGLQGIVARHRSGQSVKLKVFRNGEIFERSVTLKARGEDGTVAESDRAESSPERSPETTGSTSLPQLGMEIAPLDPSTARSSRVESGVQVESLSPYGEAANQGIVRGDVIVRIDKNAVNSPEEVKRIVDAASPGTLLLIQLKRRGGNTDLVAVEIRK